MILELFITCLFISTSTAQPVGCTIPATARDTSLTELPVFAADLATSPAIPCTSATCLVAPPPKIPTPTMITCPKFSANTMITVDTVMGVVPSTANMVGFPATHAAATLIDTCRACNVMGTLAENIFQMGDAATPDSVLWRYCYGLNSQTLFLVPNTTLFKTVWSPAAVNGVNQFKAPGTVWFNSAVQGPLNVIFAIDARSWGTAIQTSMQNAVVSMMASLSVLDRVGVMVYNFPSTTQNLFPGATGVTVAAGQNPLMDTLLPWDSNAYCTFKAFIQGTVTQKLIFQGAPNLGQPEVFLGQALQRMLNAQALNAKATPPNLFSTCNRASNIVFFTGQDLTAAQLKAMSALPFGQNSINLWIVHPGAAILTGNPTGSLLTTNLYTLSCFQETSMMFNADIMKKTNGFMLSMTDPDLPNVFSRYYALFKPTNLNVQKNPAIVYTDSVTQQTIVTSTILVNTPQAVNVLAETPTAPLDYICGMDVLTTAAAGTTPLGPSKPCPALTATTPLDFQGLVTAAAAAQPVSTLCANYNAARTTISPLDLDHAVRQGAGAPCVVTQTYWLDFAGKPRINRFVEFGVAIILNVLWFVLTWVHNPLGCCICLDKAKKLKKVQEQLDDRLDLFITPEERAKLKQKTIEAERANFKKGDMKTALAAEAENSKSVQTKTPRTIPNLGKGFSSEDEYFDPDSDQSSDVSFSSRGRT